MAHKIGRIVPSKLGSAKKTTKAAPAKSSLMASKVMDHDNYMAREDAHTVARAHAIQSDPKRCAAAAKEAARILEEKQAELKGYKSLGRRAE